MRLRRTFFLVLMLCLCTLAEAARSVRLYGYVTDSDNTGIELANIYLKGTTTGTTTNHNGYYDLQFELTDTVTLVFSMLGYVTTEQRFFTDRSVVNINIMLPTDAEVLGELEVRGIRKQLSTMESTDARNTRILPDATGGGIESLLITFAGVRQNNELSSQYNVRGGSFDENSVYVNGIEVYRPLLLRAGQQEGLSFVNPEMTQTVDFSAGGFDAVYGDKMSSVLDITYKRPTATEATLSLSLLGAHAYVGFGNQRHSELHSIRYKTSKYMLGALPTAGSYQPNFIDYQTYMTWRVSAHKHAADSLFTIDRGLQKGDWELSLLGNFSQNTYSFRPDSVSTAYGTFQQSERLTIYYDGQERDIFRTAFAALSAKGNVGRGVEIGFSLSGFYTNEQENYDITGQYRLTDNPIGEITDDTNSSTTADPNHPLQGEVDDQVLGKGTYHEHARNSLQAGVASLKHDGTWRYGNNSLRWGISLQTEYIADCINEWTWRDSAGYSLPNSPDQIDLDYSMRGQTQLFSLRTQAYLQNTYKWQTSAGDLILNAGARLNYWNFNGEVLVSPRASLVYLPGWKRDLTLRLATGLYYQAPFYKELKDTLTGDDGITRFTLNEQLRAQRSVHLILGADYYFRAWGRPFKFTGEAYYKYIDRMESYTIDNVKVRYSGKNDAEGYVLGADFKLMGELVPGADSWISFGLMRSRQRLIDETTLAKGPWLTGSNEQRYAFSMLFQDYFPRLPQLLFHIKAIYSDGLPYSHPNDFTKRYRMPSYKRVDIGATYVMKHGREKWMKNPHVDQFVIQFDVFNIVGFQNVNSYFFAKDYYGYLHQSPNYLTGRMFNLKLTIDLK